MMTPDKVLETLQQNLRIGLGAAQTLVEALPDPEKRDRFIASLQGSQLDQNMQAWAQKGELTEQEARRFIEETLTQVTSQMPGSTGASSAPSPAPVQIQIDDEEDGESASGFATKTEAEYQTEIMALTAQIDALKAELAAEREGGSGSGNIEIG